MVLNKIQKVKVSSRQHKDYNNVIQADNQLGMGAKLSAMRERRRERSRYNDPLQIQQELQQRVLDEGNHNMFIMRFLIDRFKQSENELLNATRSGDRERIEEANREYEVALRAVNENAELIENLSKMYKRGETPLMFESTKIDNPRFVIQPDGEDVLLAYDTLLPKRVLIRKDRPIELVSSENPVEEQVGQGRMFTVEKERVKEPAGAEVIKLPVVRGGALKPEQFGTEGIRTYFMPAVRELINQTNQLRNEFMNTNSATYRNQILRQVEIINRTLIDLKNAMDTFTANNPELGRQVLLPTESFIDNPENIVDEIQDLIDEFAENYNEMTEMNQQGFGLMMSKLRKKDKIYPYASGRLETAEELALRQPNAWRLAQGSQEDIEEDRALDLEIGNRIRNAQKRVEMRKKYEEERFKKLREQYGMGIVEDLMKRQMTGKLDKGKITSNVKKGFIKQIKNYMEPEFENINEIKQNTQQQEQTIMAMPDGARKNNLMRIITAKKNNIKNLENTLTNYLTVDKIDYFINPQTFTLNEERINELIDDAIDIFNINQNDIDEALGQALQ